VSSDASWTDLSGFQRDTLEAIRRIESDPDGESYGLAIKRELQSMLDEEINNGRLYQNLDELEALGLVERGEIDRRTNSYELTDAARELFQERVETLTDLWGAEPCEPGVR